MSIRHAAQPQFPLRGLREGPAAPWVRPADWPGLPWIPAADQALVGLVAVHDTDNEKLAVLCAGAYTVDWGDGTAPENVATGVKAEHQYTYSTLATPVTSRGYKTAIVKLYPQAGQNLTTINLQQTPAGQGPTAGAMAPWLDIQINAASCTSMVLGGDTSGRRLVLVEQLRIRAHNCTNLARLCEGMFSLRKLHWFNTSAVTIANSLCNFCASLEELPLFDFANATNMNSAFRDMYSLKVAPAFNFAKATDITNLYYLCYALVRAEAMTFGVAVAMTGVFNSCFALREIGAISATLVNGYPNAFTSNKSLARCQIVGAKVTHTYANCALTATAINEIFTNLASGVTGQTITVTGNPGAATCDTSIATAKGWTVVT